MNRYRYSIIIPHHDIPELLSRCLKSIPVRDDLQIIVVDDCSPDADSYLSRVPELGRDDVLFISTEKNCGAGHARNIGLKAAQGDYLIFVDADDVVTSLFDDILEDHAEDVFDILFFNGESVSDAGQRTERCEHLHGYIKHALGNKPERGLFELRYAFGEPWCKIVRRDLIETNEIRFDEVPIHNDTTFSYLAGYRASKILVDDRVGYRKIDRPEGISNRRSRELQLVSVEVFLRKNRFLADHFVGYEDCSYAYHLFEVLSSGNRTLYQDMVKLSCQYGFSEHYLLMALLKYGWGVVKNKLR